MKIALLSDTHGIFREDWIPHITGCDYLIHAGDVDSRTCYEKIKSLGVPAYFVRGNCDKGDWAENLPEFLSVPIGGKIFFIAHNQYDFPCDITDADFLIYGHTHVYAYYGRFGKTYINPGSAGQSRGDSKSMAVLELKEDGSHEIKRILL
jgi:hypothetical protein